MYIHHCENELCFLLATSGDWSFYQVCHVYRLYSIFLEVELKVKYVLAATSEEYKPGWRLPLKYKLD